MNVVGSVGTTVGSAGLTDDHIPASLAVRMLGPFTVVRDGIQIVLPGSRKVRALFAYLALAPSAVPRSQLCELLWDVPDDPRGELRWCLSKIRRLVDGKSRKRLRTEGDTVRLDLADCDVDALSIRQATVSDVAASSVDGLRIWADLIEGEFLAGLDVDRCPNFQTWLVSQRRQFRNFHIQVLETLVERSPDDGGQIYLERWAALTPLDERVHLRVLQTLARQQRYREGNDHLAAVVRLFASEGLDSAPLRDAWRSARSAPFRFPAATISAQPAPATAIADTAPPRASIAVMPFDDETSMPRGQGGVADALVHDIITRLAKLRSLFVIAQGSVFALQDRHVQPDEAARILNVEYLVSGSFRRDGSRVIVRVELAEARTARIIWTEVFNRSIEDAFLVLDEIGNKIVASIANEIETVERNRAILKPPNSLTAWEAHHRGLWHMYRFNKTDNEQAKRFFETGVRLDPTFARAYAGLSFTHFQNAFQGWAVRQPEIDRAFEVAGLSLMVDDRDPAAHWAMGRALWLRGNYDQAFAELEASVDISPNFAQGYYTLAFVHSQVGDTGTAITAADQSRHLSPFDPMLFGILGARAMALVRQSRFHEAADWGVKAATRPNAHAHILAIAALSLALAGRSDEARVYLATIRRTLPTYTVEDFFAAMQFAPDGIALFRAGAREIGME